MTKAKETENKKKSKECFLISRIGETGSPEWTESMQAYKYLVKPVLEELGYNVTRADESAHANMLEDIIQRLIEADLVVVDLSGANTNVFYELGIRHATGKHSVAILNKGERPPFDLVHVRYVVYSLGDPDVLSKAKDSLKDRVIWSEENQGTPDNPISINQNLEFLRFRANA